MHLCFIIAMKAEADPLINNFRLTKDNSFAPSLPPCAWTGEGNGHRISVVINGKDVHFELDFIGTQAATLTTHLAIDFYKPDIIVSAGTAGGFAEKGATIGEVFLSYPNVVFHDRRIAIPGWDKMGIGRFPVYDTRNIAASLGIKTAVITTGNSLDMPPVDEANIKANGGEIKEMEAAAVAWVCSLYNIPMFCIKAVTDLVDVPHPTHEQFLKNLNLAVNNLTKSCIDVINLLPKS